MLERSKFTSRLSAVPARVVTVGVVWGADGGSINVCYVDGHRSMETGVPAICYSDLPRSVSVWPFRGRS